MAPHIRWLIQRDMPYVAEIDSRSLRPCWSEEQIINHRRQRNGIGMVAEFGEQVVGFMLYSLHTQHLHLRRLAVHPDYLRMGVGRALLDKIASKLSSHRRTHCLFDVPDHLLGAHLWLKRCGWMASPLVGEDSYRFWLRVEKEAAV